MISILFDEDFHGHSIALFRRRYSSVIQSVTAHQAGLRSRPDPELLDYAAEHGFVLATRDLRSMLGFAKRRIVSGITMSGIIAVTRPASAPQIVDDLFMLAQSETPQSMMNQFRFIPF